MPRHSHRRWLLLAAACLTVAACGDDDAATVGSDDPTTSSTTASTTTIASPDPTTGDAALASPDAAVEFFVESEQACADHAERTGNAPPEPARFQTPTAEETDTPGVYLLVDGLGDRLHVDLNDEVIYSEEGPDGVLVRSYSFGCPETLYLGTLDH